MAGTDATVGVEGQGDSFPQETRPKTKADDLIHKLTGMASKLDEVIEGINFVTKRLDDLAVTPPIFHISLQPVNTGRPEGSGDISSSSCSNFQHELSGDSLKQSSPRLFGVKSSDRFKQPTQSREKLLPSHGQSSPSPEQFLQSRAQSPQSRVQLKHSRDSPEPSEDTLLSRDQSLQSELHLPSTSKGSSQSENVNSSIEDRGVNCTDTMGKSPNLDEIPPPLQTSSPAKSRNSYAASTSTSAQERQFPEAPHRLASPLLRSEERSETLCSEPPQKSSSRSKSPRSSRSRSPRHSRQCSPQPKSSRMTLSSAAAKFLRSLAARFFKASAKEETKEPQEAKETALDAIDDKGTEAGDTTGAIYEDKEIMRDATGSTDKDKMATHVATEMVLGAKDVTLNAKESNLDAVNRTEVGKKDSIQMSLGAEEETLDKNNGTMDETKMKPHTNVSPDAINMTVGLEGEDAAADAVNEVLNARDLVATEEILINPVSPTAPSAQLSRGRSGTKRADVTDGTVEDTLGALDAQDMVRDEALDGTVGIRGVHGTMDANNGTYISSDGIPGAANTRNVLLEESDGTVHAFTRTMESTDGTSIAKDSNPNRATPTMDEAQDATGGRDDATEKTLDSDDEVQDISNGTAGEMLAPLDEIDAALDEISGTLDLDFDALDETLDFTDDTLDPSDGTFDEIYDSLD